MCLWACTSPSAVEAGAYLCMPAQRRSPDRESVVLVDSRDAESEEKAHTREVDNVLMSM